MKPNVVAFYSAQGGSGRTTSLLNLADHAAQQGLRVLVIDCACQMSATSFLLERKGIDFGQYLDRIFAHYSLYTTEFAKRKADHQSRLDATVERTWNLFDLLINHEPGVGYLAHLRTYDSIGIEVGCPAPASSPPQGTGSISLVCGHPMLSEMEMQICMTPGDFSPRFTTLIEESVRRHHSDIVFLDLDSARSVLNQNFLACADYYVSPLFPGPRVLDLDKGVQEFMAKITEGKAPKRLATLLRLAPVASVQGVPQYDQGDQELITSLRMQGEPPMIIRSQSADFSARTAFDRMGKEQTDPALDEVRMDFEIAWGSMWRQMSNQ